MKTELIWLNNVNGADLIEEKYAARCLTSFEGKLNGAVMGSAYGGSIEAIAKLWGGRGEIHGFDVFEELHPTHLAEDGQSFEATCMGYWYADPKYGTDKLSYEYQITALKDMDLNNAHLIKGEVNKNSLKDIPYLNYAFLDMDILASMKAGFEAVLAKLVPNGYLLMHDVLGNIPSLDKWYKEEIKHDKRVEIIKEYEKELVSVLRRKP